MKQHLKSVLSIGMLVGAVVSVSASATPVKLTEVTNNNTATNSCSVVAVYGTNGPGYQYYTYKVTCGTEVVYINQNTTFNGGSNYCTVSANNPPTYSVSGTCSLYSVYKN